MHDANEQALPCTQPEMPQRMTHSTSIRAVLTVLAAPQKHGISAAVIKNKDTVVYACHAHLALPGTPHFPRHVELDIPVQIRGRPRSSLPDELYQALLLKMKGQLMILLKDLYGRTPHDLSWFIPPARHLIISHAAGDCAVSFPLLEKGQMQGHQQYAGSRIVPASGLRSLTRSMASSTLPLCTALRISMRSVIAARSMPGCVRDSC